MLKVKQMEAGGYTLHWDGISRDWRFISESELRDLQKQLGEMFIDSFLAPEQRESINHSWACMPGKCSDACREVVDKSGNGCPPKKQKPKIEKLSDAHFVSWEITTSILKRKVNEIIERLNEL